jgi:HSP20 family protein
MTHTEKNLSLFDTTFMPTFLRQFGFHGLYPEQAVEAGARYGLSEDEQAVYFEVPMPGVKTEDIQVTHDKEMITIKAQHQNQYENRKIYQKTSYQYAMSFTLPSSLDESQDPEASYEAGVLHLRFNKKKKYEPKKITVRAS